MSNQEIEIVTNDAVEDVRRTGRAVGVYALAMATLAFLGLLAYVVWLVHTYLIYLGYIVLFGAGVVLVCLIATPVILLIRYAMRSDFFDIGANGLVLRNMFGKTQVFSPLAPGAMTRAQGSKKKDASTFPMLSMLDMIDQGIIAPGNTKVVIGYLPNGELEIGKRPNTAVIAGQGRSGKTRRAILMLGQDMIGLAHMLNRGARVIVCDPHGAGKLDAFSKIIEPLAPWLTIARTEEEIAQVTREFTGEMEKRLAGTSEVITEDGHYMPWAIYFDEWSRLMNGDKYSEDSIEAMISCVQSCAQEYAGVDGYCTLIGQSWTNDDCGGTAIRRAIQEAYVHHISSEYAQFLIKPRKWFLKCDELRIRDCIYRNYEGRIVQVTTPAVSDDTPSRLAGILQELCPLNAQEPRQIPAYSPRSDFYNSSTLAGQVMYYKPEISERLKLIPSPSQSRETTEDFELDFDTPEEVNAVKPLNKRVNAGEDVTLAGEGFTVKVKDTPRNLAPVIAQEPEALYTPEKELLIVNAAREIAQENNGEVTRKAIAERLNWNNKHWPTIKAVCDKWQIAMR